PEGTSCAGLRPAGVAVVASASVEAYRAAVGAVKLRGDGPQIRGIFSRRDPVHAGAARSGIFSAEILSEKRLDDPTCRVVSQKVGLMGLRRNRKSGQDAGDAIPSGRSHDNDE